MNQFNLLQEKNETESEISLINIVEFVQDSWKHLVLAGIVGALLGFSSWYFLVSFNAQLVLLNNTMLKTTAGSLVIAEVLMLMYLIGRRLIGRLKLTARA